MGDGYHVSLSAMSGLTDSFSQRQQDFHQVAGPMRDGAAGISTGDPALDTETRDLINFVKATYARVGDVLASVGGAVDVVAGNYQDGDTQVATSYQQLMDGGQGAPDSTSSTS